MFNELTEKDIKKMQEEIDYRISVLRPKISQDIIDAKAFGDLSENAEYHIARREKGKNESRIEYLKNMIQTAQVVKLNNNQDEIGIFDKVTVLFEDDNETQIIQLSTTMQNDAINGIISKESPFGKAIIEKKVGDRVEIKVNKDYSYYVQIKAIEKSNGDNIDLPIK